MRTMVPASSDLRQRVRLSARPVMWAAISLFVYFASYPLGHLGVPHGLLLATPFLLATAGLGWKAGVVLAPFAVLLMWARTALEGKAPDATDHLLLAMGLAVATFAGSGLYDVWRRTEQLARHAERRSKLLQEAAVDLNHETDQAGLFAAAPRLLSDILPFAHASIFVPSGTGLQLASTWRWHPDPGLEVPLASVMGRALLAREPQYVANTALDQDYVSAPAAEATRSELALPLIVGKDVRGVLNLEHVEVDAFSQADHVALAAFVRMIEEVLERIDATTALAETVAFQQFMARLNQRLLLAVDSNDVAEAALDEVLEMFELDMGVLLELHDGKLRPTAVRGDPPPGLAARVRDGFPFEGVLRHAWETREIVLIDDISEHPTWTTSTEARAVALVPIVDPAGQMQALLVMTRYREPLPRWGDNMRELLATVSVPLGAAFSRATLNRQLVATLDAIKQLRSADGPEALYLHAAKSAFELVRNAEAVSILVRHGDDFYYEAAVGYELEFLQTEAGPFSYSEMLGWYRHPSEYFEAGRGRILRGSEILETSSSAAHSPANKVETRVSAMQCQLAVPIVDRDGVVALLNVDNFSTPDAFSDDAVRIAEAFAQHVTAVVREAEHMLDLERSAVTDELTGLGNRAGFERAFKQELARARRYEHRLNLVLIDLDKFKQINDRFGHAEGDKVLIAVASVLRNAVRATDQVFRWGGDEFALLLPDVKPEEAQAAVKRVGQLLEKVETNGVPVKASIGVASYPVDGLDRETLLGSADHKMYTEKRAADGTSRRRPRGGSYSSAPSGATGTSTSTGATSLKVGLDNT
ncbi:MAG: diguanylate cyclase [Trueperaceae bacterium]|nr:diguanylate cyclase [Trueperaceae bacterium]HRQ10449.1 diguanylate cyclase [Trueperaceae bacterium]